MDPELDQKEQFNVDLDPQKTLDFALFKCVASHLMNPAESEESMAMLINCLLDAREPDEDKKLPPLDVIIYKGTRNLCFILQVKIEACDLQYLYRIHVSI
jgi:hypothetical protein